MCKKKSPDKNKASTGCVRETHPIKNQHGICKRRSADKKGNQHGMCKRNSQHKNEGIMGCVRETPPVKNQHGMCKRRSVDKTKPSTGCVRETPQIKMKPARDV